MQFVQPSSTIGELGGGVGVEGRSGDGEYREDLPSVSGRVVTFLRSPFFSVLLDGKKNALLAM